MDCKNVAAQLPGKVFFPASPQYNETGGSYFAAFENELSPICIVRPASAAEVSAIVGIIGSSSWHATPLAIKGGGHTPWAGAANIDNGVTMDLRDLTGVHVNPLTGLATIRAGERWTSVYQQLGTQGLAVAGGRVSKVGVAGLITGGGLSYFSATNGFVCDNVVNYEIALQAFNDFATSSTPDEQAHILMATSWSAGAETGVSNIYHARPVAAPPSLKPFTVIQPQIFGSLCQDSLLGFANEQSAFSIDGARQLYFTTSFRLDVQFMLHVRELWLEALKPLQSVPGFMLSLVFQPFTKGIIAKSVQLGGSSLGLSPDNGPLVITLLNSVHTNADDDSKVVTAVLGLIQDIDNAAALQNKSATYRFTNYGYKDQKILEGYGKQSIARLQAVSRKYDPSSLFQRMVPGGFKLSKVSEESVFE
ncbi:MAG: hypothetical protein Q9181_003723 [Wetmoreana brouardii]